MPIAGDVGARFAAKPGCWAVLSAASNLSLLPGAWLRDRKGGDGERC